MKSAKEAREHLKKVDLILGRVIETIALPTRKRHTDRFYALVRAIIRQQLSGKAADSIERKFIEICGKGKFPTASAILKIPDNAMRRAGLSYGKVSYIKNLAHAVHTEELDLNVLHKLSNEAAIESLIKIKGIGRWTAEMFLMFTLKRPDIFSYGDLGLRNAMVKLYKLRKTPSRQRAEEISKKWSPHRTLACLYLWASLTKETDKKLILGQTWDNHESVE